MWWMHPMWGDGTVSWGMGGGGGMMIGGLMMMVFWLLVAGGTAWLAMRLMQGTPGTRLNDPEIIVKVRYARGEISQEEFQRLRQDLKR